MISTLLGRIANLFERDYLFSSFLPAVLFLSSLAIPIAWSLGILSIFAYIETMTAVEKGLAVCVAGLFTITFGYLLHALRPTFIKFWSGSSEDEWLLGFVRLGKAFQKRRFSRMKRRAHRCGTWATIFEEFQRKTRELWHDNGDNPGQAEIEKLTAVVSNLRVDAGPDVARRKLELIIEAFRRYNGNRLQTVYSAVKAKILDDWSENEQQRIRNEQSKLDRAFAPSSTMRATTLGNYIESYNYYPFLRYKMEPQIFWQRLTTIMKKEDLDTVQDQRILLDFALTMTTLSVLYIFFTLFVGPWLWSRPSLWILLTFAGIVSSYVFYKLAVFVACELGDLVRASFDLNRLKLMRALSRKVPPTLEAERRQWDELSQLAVYGNVTNDFEIAQTENP